MKFTPKSEDEIKMFSLLPPGTYDFEVVMATDKQSKSGNDMIELKLKLWDSEGREHIIFDYLLESVAHKLRHFCDSMGMLDKYNDGIISSHDCLNKTGKVQIIIQKDKTGAYPDKNSVKDYIKSDLVLTQQIKTNDFKSDDIPF